MTLLRLVGAGAAVLWAAAAAAQTAPRSCQRDIDCPGDMVCERAQCVLPASPAPQPPPAPPAPSAPATTPPAPPAAATPAQPAPPPPSPTAGSPWFASHRGDAFLNQFELSARGDLLLGDLIGGGGLGLGGMVGGRTGGGGGGSTWMGARYGLGLEAEPLLISPPGTNNVNFGVLLAIPLQLGFEFGTGAAVEGGWRGTVFGVDLLPQLQCVTVGSSKLDGCAVDPLALGISVDPGVALLGSGQEAGHLRFRLRAVAPVGGPMFELGLGAGMAWY